MVVVGLLLLWICSSSSHAHHYPTVASVATVVDGRLLLQIDSSSSHALNQGYKRNLILGFHRIFLSAELSSPQLSLPCDSDRCDSVNCDSNYCDSDYCNSDYCEIQLFKQVTASLLLACAAGL